MSEFVEAELPEPHIFEWTVSIFPKGSKRIEFRKILD